VFGKLVGGTLGFMMGGPLGALMGAAVGHNFDQEAWKKTFQFNSTDNSSDRQLFLQTTFHLAGYIAKADGRVSESEIATARALMDHLHLEASQRATAIEAFTAGKQAHFPLEATLDQFQKLSASQPKLLQQLLEMQLNIAYADGALHPETHARLLAISRRLGLSRLQFEALHNLFRGQHYWSRQQHRQQSQQNRHDQSHERYNHGPRPKTAVNSLKQAYVVLGLTQEATPNEIKLAYRRLLKRHHPDKLAADNASTTEIKWATEKTREITAAYERIREAHGF
jgi:DnaJ like chaperone protein